MAQQAVAVCWSHGLEHLETTARNMVAEFLIHLGHFAEAEETLTRWERRHAPAPPATTRAILDLNWAYLARCRGDSRTAYLLLSRVPANRLRPPERVFWLTEKSLTYVAVGKPEVGRREALAAVRAAMETGILELVQRATTRLMSVFAEKGEEA